MQGNYKVITLCGSTRFKEQFIEAQKRLTLEGNIVISVGLFGHSGDDEVWTDGTKQMLDDMHKRKIDMADEIFVINVGGYIGSSTRSEIDYALANGKAVRYLETVKRIGLDGYTSLFAKLNTNKWLGHTAPHKAVMLLSVVDLVEDGVIDSPQFGLTEQLEERFRQNWKQYVGSSMLFNPAPATPFYHLCGEPFWRLYAADGTAISRLASTPSVSYLRTHGIKASIDYDLFCLMQSPEGRERLRAVLIQNYLQRAEPDILKVMPVMAMAVLTRIWM